LNEDVLRQYLFKETEIVQKIITRMAYNSFLIKGWSVTLVVASLLFKGNSYHYFVAFVPWFVFWCLDAYFLRIEKLYRYYYDWLIKNRLSNDENLLDMNSENLEKRFKDKIPCLVQTALSKTLIIFYGVLGLIIISFILINYYPLWIQS